MLSGNSAGPLVKTGRPLDARFFPDGGELYVNAVIARELGEAAGNVRPEVYAKVLEDNEALAARVAELERESAGYKAEAESLMVFVGPKIWGRAQHLRKRSGFYGRKLVNKQLDYMDEKIDEAELDEAFEKASAE